MGDSSQGAPKRRRGPGRPFEKGKSGNPGGRPRSMLTLLREKTRDGEDVLDAIVALAKDPSHRDHMRANEWCGDRLFGKVPDKIEISEVDRRAEELSKLSHEELRARLDELRKAIEESA